MRGLRLCVGLGFLSVCVPANASVSFLTRDLFLKWDPQDNAENRVWAPQGASFDVMTCENDWCYGKAFGQAEGWVLETDLSPTKPKEPFGLETEPEIEKFHVFASFNTMLGGGKVETVSGALMKRSSSLRLGAGAGRRWALKNETLLDADLGVGLLFDTRSASDRSAETKNASPYVSVGVKNYGIYNEYFSFGAFFETMLRFSRGSADFAKKPSFLLFTAGPVIVHELGLAHATTAVWKPQVAFSFAEVFVGLGVDVNF
jgi:hypothetical protein